MIDAVLLRKIVRLAFSEQDLLKAAGEKCSSDEFERLSLLLAQFKKAKKQYEIAVRQDQNADVVQSAKNKKKRSFTSIARYGGRGSATSWVANVKEPGLEVVFESGADVESRSQEQQNPEEWKTSTGQQQQRIEAELTEAANQVIAFLEVMPWWASFDESFEERFYESKYQEANLLTEQGIVSGDDFLRGMEYFARLGNYKDSEDQFAQCSRSVYREQAGLWVRIALGISIVGMFICWVFGYSHLGFKVFRIGRFWSGILQAAGAGILLFGLPTLLISQIILPIAMLLRKKGILNKLQYSYAEEEWEAV